MSRFYSKPALTLTQQVDLLQSWDMIVADTRQAGFHLSQINCYRLGDYWLPFETDHASLSFTTGASLESDDGKLRPGS